MSNNICCCCDKKLKPKVQLTSMYHITAGCFLPSFLKFVSAKTSSGNITIYNSYRSVHFRYFLLNRLTRVAQKISAQKLLNSRMACDNPVVCFTQPEFIEKVRQAENPEFNVVVLDDATVFHVRVLVEGEAANAGNGESTSACNGLRDVKNGCVAVFPKILGDEVEGPDEVLVKEVLSAASATSGQIKLVLLIGRKLNSDGIKVFLQRDTGDPVKCDILVQPSKELLYSRSKGILESGLLEKRKVAVVGLGSGGSFVAVELAKAGVGHFVLIDFDRIELNNIARHTCGLDDLGRYKTNAVRDMLLNKNPFVTVETHCCTINDLPKARTILKDCDLIISATDNIRSRLNINSVSIEHGITALYGKCATRAAGGDVLRVRPKTGPCFSCVFSNLSLESSQEVSSFRQAREAQPDYVPDDDVEATIQVGLSSDITPIGTMIVKLALVELCQGHDSALATLEKDLIAPFYRWANRREQDFASYPEGGFTVFNQPSVLRWYPVEIEKKKECTACGKLPEITEEEAAFFGAN